MSTLSWERPRELISLSVPNQLLNANIEIKKKKMMKDLVFLSRSCSLHLSVDLQQGWEES